MEAPPRLARALKTSAAVAAALLGAAAEAQPVVTAVAGGASGLERDVDVGVDSVVGSVEADWIDVRGRGFGPDAVVRLRTDGVDAEITSEQRVRYRSAGELAVRATFGTEASRWTIEVMSGGKRSTPHPFAVVAPRPVVQHVEVTNGGVLRTR